MLPIIQLFIYLFITLVLNEEGVFVINQLQWLGDAETTRILIELTQEDRLQKIIPQLEYIKI
jgi:hypothetical protein